MKLRLLNSHLFLSLLLFINSNGDQNQLNIADLDLQKQDQKEEILLLDFENDEIGEYSKENLIDDIGTVKGGLFDGRANIEKDPIHGKVLKVMYPQGSIGPKQGGIQFVKSLPKSNEYYLDYYLKFKKGFDFKLGGKLPGLTSGGTKFTGGVHPTNGEGWSARYMWRTKGEMVVYFYHLGLKKKWGDNLKLNATFVDGRWYRITQFIKINSNNQSNGTLEVWIDGGSVYLDESITYRKEPLGEIDSFYFSTFHGGNTQDWAPKNDSYIYFDDFKVTKNMPFGLN